MSDHRSLEDRTMALDLVAQSLYMDIPIHPRMLDRFREIIGETTTEEETYLRSARRAGEADAERSCEQMSKLAEAGRRFLGHARERGEKITHGRHCTCGACAREDWTNAELAPCGMHGSSCPREYQPWGMAGTVVSRHTETRR